LRGYAPTGIKPIRRVPDLMATSSLLNLSPDPVYGSKGSALSNTSQRSKAVIAMSEKEMLSTFSANLETLPKAPLDANTAAWWLTQPEAWSACRQNLESPRDAMARYVTWLKSLPGKPVFVAYPAAFNFPFVYWYLTEFVGENPFGYSAIDIKTYSMALMRKPYRMCGKRSMPAEWLDPVPHTRVALDDAIEQGRLFCNMLRANRAVD
jgi:hypothetical protein